jgi:hypothetical protein
LQAAYDPWQARKTAKPALRKIKPVKLEALAA